MPELKRTKTQIMLDRLQCATGTSVPIPESDASRDDIRLRGYDLCILCFEKYRT